MVAKRGSGSRARSKRDERLITWIYPVSERHTKVRRRLTQGETAKQVAERRRLRQLAIKKEADAPDAISPLHYRGDGWHHEHWDVMEEWLGEEGFRGYLIGCATKYLCRWKDKGGVQDLKKANAYIERLIRFEEGAKPSEEVK